MSLGRDGAISYPVGSDAVKLFSAPGEPVVLYNAGTVVVIVSTATPGPNARGLPLAPGATIQWDERRDCYAVTAAQFVYRAPVEGLLFVMSGGPLDQADPPTVPFLGTIVDMPSAVAPTTNPLSAFVDSVPQNTPAWVIPRPFTRLVVTGFAMSVVNSTAAKIEAELQLANTPDHSLTTYVFHRVSLNVGANGGAQLSQPIAPGAVVIPQGVVPAFIEEAGVVGLTYNITVNGLLYY